MGNHREEELSSLESPQATPRLGIPVSPHTVDVRIINTTCYQKTRTELLLKSSVPGHDTSTFPSYAFLVTNRQKGVNILFDIGMRKDWRKACPLALAPYISDDGSDTLLQVAVEKDIVEILDDESSRTGVRSTDITAVVWSHHHFDHRGDMTRFHPRTKLVVGPGLLQAYLGTELHESEIEGREVIELGEQEFTLDIGGYSAHDALGDGSFYIMSCPGHTVGHLCALARVTSKPSTFVFLGGDCAYHCGEFRPSPYTPLPHRVGFKPTSWHYSKSLPAAPPALKSRKILLCSGDFIRDVVHPNKSATEAFYETPPEPVVESYKDACESVTKMEWFDAQDNVLVCISHDAHLMNVLPFYPHSLNDWQRKGYKRRLRWEFLNDFDLDQNILSPAIRHVWR